MSVQRHPGSLSALPDDRLGTAAVSVVVAELQWLPDVAPAVMDRISRDAVAYPEQFDRRPGMPAPDYTPPPLGRSASRAFGRLAVIGVILFIIVALVLLAATVSATPVSAQDEAAEATAEPVPAASATPSTPEPSPEATPLVGFDPATVHLRTDLLATGFEELVYVTDDGYDKSKCLYAVEKGGKVWLVTPDGRRSLKPFLDLSGKVATGTTQGLHSIAFHPDFGKNGRGRFFARWDNPQGTAVVAEFQGTACRVSAKGSKMGKKWVIVEQPYPNNNAGWIGFGPDDMLYVPLGDGGGRPPGDAEMIGQDPRPRLAKVLRIDVDRPDGIAKDNPYVREQKGKLKASGKFPRETWARGVRDPRRASFDRETGDFWFGDAGQDHLDQVGWEEVNLVRADSVTSGRAAPNFGWSHVEGADTCHPVNQPECDPTAYTPPVFAYEVAQGSAITGGYVYRGDVIEELKGVYLFSDFTNGTVWGLDADAVYKDLAVTAHPLLEAPQGFVSFGEDDRGELYLVALEGSIYRLGSEAR